MSTYTLVIQEVMPNGKTTVVDRTFTLPDHTEDEWMVNGVDTLIEALS
jgi:hypothetical protein